MEVEGSVIRTEGGTSPVEAPSLLETCTVEESPREMRLNIEVGDEDAEGIAYDEMDVAA